MTDYSDWGAEDIEDEKEIQEGWETLVASNIRQASKIRQMEVALSAERSKVKELQRVKGSAGDVLGELAIHKFLDNLSEAGLPSTVYSTFSPTYREYLLRALTYWAETANRLMGEYLALSPEAIGIRDTKYEKADKTHDGIFLRGSANVEDFPETKQFFDVIGDIMEKGANDND